MLNPAWPKRMVSGHDMAVLRKSSQIALSQTRVVVTLLASRLRAGEPRRGSHLALHGRLGIQYTHEKYDLDRPRVGPSCGAVFGGSSHSDGKWAGCAGDIGPGRQFGLRGCRLGAGSAKY